MRTPPLRRAYPGKGISCGKVAPVRDSKPDPLSREQIAKRNGHQTGHPDSQRERRQRSRNCPCNEPFGEHREPIPGDAWRAAARPGRLRPEGG